MTIERFICLEGPFTDSEGDLMKFADHAAALAEKEAECERLRKENEQLAISVSHFAVESRKLAAEAERLRDELKEIWSAAFVDPDEISETMARNIVRVIRDAADKALKPQL